MIKTLVGIDRDGTLIKDPFGYFPYGIDNWEEKIEFFGGVYEGLKLLQSKSIYIAIISNQSGVPRGFYSKETVDRVNELINNRLIEYGIKPLPFFYCPYIDIEYAKRYGISLDNPFVDDEKAKKRKPNIGLLEEAMKYYGLNFAGIEIFTIGDKDIDVYTALNAGGFGILVRTGEYEKYEQLLYGKPNVFIADNFYQACQLISGRLI